MLLSGCAKTPVEDTSPVASAPQWMSSEDFLARGWEIEATLTDTATDPARTALVALTVDAGGGGTIAYIMALYGMEVIDSGVAVLNMHAPWEIISKVDLYEAFRGYVVFLKEA